MTLRWKTLFISMAQFLVILVFAVAVYALLALVGFEIYSYTGGGR